MGTAVAVEGCFLFLLVCLVAIPLELEGIPVPVFHYTNATYWNPFYVTYANGTADCAALAPASSNPIRLVYNLGNTVYMAFMMPTKEAMLSFLYHSCWVVQLTEDLVALVGFLRYIPGGVGEVFYGATQHILRYFLERLACFPIQLLRMLIALPWLITSTFDVSIRWDTGKVFEEKFWLDSAATLIFYAVVLNALESDDFETKARREERIEAEHARLVTRVITWSGGVFLNEPPTRCQG